MKQSINLMPKSLRVGSQFFSAENGGFGKDAATIMVDSCSPQPTPSLTSAQQPDGGRAGYSGYTQVLISPLILVFQNPRSAEMNYGDVALSPLKHRKCHEKIYEVNANPPFE